MYLFVFFKHLYTDSVIFYWIDNTIQDIASSTGNMKTTVLFRRQISDYSCRLLCIFKQTINWKEVNMQS